MPVTATKSTTVKDALNQAGVNLNQFADAAQKVKLGDMAGVVVLDTGTITASATVTLPVGALFVQSARVVTSGTAASVGTYLVADAGATMIVPPGGANVAVGIAQISADGKTITFPNTITRAVIRYVPGPAVALTADLENKTIR